MGEQCTGGRGVHFQPLATDRHLSEVIVFPVSWKIYLIAIDRYLSPKFAYLVWSGVWE
jgi:hypothetical protein